MYAYHLLLYFNLYVYVLSYMALGVPSKQLFNLEVNYIQPTAPSCIQSWKVWDGVFCQILDWPRNEQAERQNGGFYFKRTIKFVVLKYPEFEGEWLIQKAEAATIASDGRLEHHLAHKSEHNLKLEDVEVCPRRTVSRIENCYTGC